MHSRDGARWIFDPGALCLEFLVTGGPGPLARWETLDRPEGLRTWLADSRLHLDPAQVDVTVAALASARRVRDALWRVVHDAAHGTTHEADDDAGEEAELTPTPEDLAEVNRAAARPPLVPRIAADGTHEWTLPADAEQVVSTVARDAIDLLTGPYADRIRECDAHNCQLVFVDTSRPGRRRWCSMERCGNRHKLRALRARRDHS
ncbi:CGNR zinc finger domain-containing protein [Actinopolymorpha cephalotaxi]|nr:CGNR zinc finger domain-containing protein [Actinopolymorpha cephalotaxi]SFH26050.1 CGNR zinc finger domain-containing protein [Actinopolymorpha cephalotaxi]